MKVDAEKLVAVGKVAGLAFTLAGTAVTAWATNASNKLTLAKLVADEALKNK